MTAVDVVIAAYDPGHYLREALASVLAQTVDDWAAVVIDDGSTEDLSWVDDLDPRIARLRQPNAGLSAARNRGIAVGSAPLLAFLDADDVWLPGKLEAQIAAMGDSNVAVCSTAFTMIDADGLHAGDGFHGYAESHAELLQGCGICVSTVMVRRADLERVGGFSESLQQVQDWDLWLRLTRGDRQAIKLGRPLAQYRLHGQNMSQDYANMLQESLLVLDRNVSISTQPLARIGRRRVRRLAGSQAFDAFRRTRSPSHLIQAFRLHPRYTARAIVSRIRPSAES